MDYEDVSNQIKLAKEGLELARSYSKNKALPARVRAEGVEQVKAYNKRLIELLGMLYRG